MLHYQATCYSMDISYVITRHATLSTIRNTHNTYEGETWTRTLRLVDLQVGVSSAQNSKYITSSLYAVLLTIWETRGKNLEFLKKLDTHVQGSLLLHFKTFQRISYSSFLSICTNFHFTLLLFENISPRRFQMCGASA